MLDKPFHLAPHNSHYLGQYTESMKEWRRICSIDKADHIQALLKGVRVESVLEVGCGTGSVIAEVANRGIGKQYVGIDMADPNAHPDPSAGEIKLLQYDGKKIPFDDASFDLVFASHVVEHVLDPRGFMAELSRVARGVIYIEVPCELNIRATRNALQSSVDTGHINMYSPESFLLLLQTSNLDVQDIQIFDHSLEVLQFPTSPMKGRVHKALRGSLLKLNPVFASRIFTYHCGAICRRPSEQ